LGNTKWLKKPGDKVERDEPLFEISTDKVDAEIPSPSAGVLKEIKVGEGKTVPIQTVVGVIDAAGDGAGSAKGAAPAPAPAKAAAPAPAAKPTVAPPPAPPPVTAARPTALSRRQTAASAAPAVEKKHSQLASSATLATSTRQSFAVQSLMDIEGIRRAIVAGGSARRRSGAGRGRCVHPPASRPLRPAAARVRSRKRHRQAPVDSAQVLESAAARKDVFR
jgi:hypothetical protein